MIDSREQDKLDFYMKPGLEVEVDGLEVGDYAGVVNGVLLPIRIERKSIADLFGSFSSGYEREKAKILKAQALNLKYILAIEGTVFEVREGHQYQKDGEVRQSKKDGLSQVRQLMTCYSKGYFDIWWCRGRREMAFMIYEYFLAQEKLLKTGGGK